MGNKQIKATKAPLGGLEPPTFRLTAERASQLRHRGPTDGLPATNRRNLHFPFDISMNYLMNENNFEKYMAIYPCILEKEKRKKGKKRTRCHLLWTTTAYECRFRG